jgi:hypothetical protein
VRKLTKKDEEVIGLNVINFVLKEIVQEENILSRIIKLEASRKDLEASRKDLEASRKDTEKRLKILESAILTERKTIKK